MPIVSVRSRRNADRRADAYQWFMDRHMRIANHYTRGLLTEDERDAEQALLRRELDAALWRIRHPFLARLMGY